MTQLLVGACLLVCYKKGAPARETTESQPKALNYPQLASIIYLHSQFSFFVPSLGLSCSIPGEIYSVPPYPKYILPSSIAWSVQPGLMK